MYIADVNKWFKERDVGEIVLDNERIWLIMYADDIVLVAKNRNAMLDMTDRLKRFLKQRKLVMCVEKTKMLVFNRKRKEKKEMEMRKGEHQKDTDI